jgi:Domain of unknown function (DUF4328)
VWHDSQHNITPPPYNGPNLTTPASLVVGLVFWAAVIVALVWQHRAASAGRALGIPSDQSPAWGVGSWFVPIVWFWIPYQAVRNCLPAGDPSRPRILHWWLAYLLTVAVGTAWAITALFSTGAALVLAIPIALADLAIIAWAPRIVASIGTAHRESVVERALATDTVP